MREFEKPAYCSLASCEVVALTRACAILIALNLLPTLLLDLYNLAQATR